MSGGSEQSTAIRKDAMIKALEATMGIVKQATDMVGIHRTTHYKWLEDDPEYKTRVADITELLLDFLETKAVKLVNDGDTAMTIFMLKTRAKKRGYIERQELTGPDGGPIEVKQITGMQVT